MQRPVGAEEKLEGAGVSVGLLAKRDQAHDCLPRLLIFAIVSSS